MKKKFYIRCSIALMINVLALQVTGQNIEETQKLAAHFFSIKDYEQTELLCHRILCFGNEKNKLAAHELLGKTYLETQQFKKSALNFQEASKLEPTNPDLFFDYIFALINNKQFDIVITELESYKDKFSHLDRVLLYKGIAYFLLDDVEEAKIHLDSLLAMKCERLEPALDSLLDEIKYKKPKKAQVLSAIIPGSGQIYSGDLKNGSKAFGLNAGLLAATLYISKEYSIVNAGFATFQWFFRYYTSNIKNAEKIANKKNEKIKSVEYEKVLHLLKHCES